MSSQVLEPPVREDVPVRDEVVDRKSVASVPGARIWGLLRITIGWIFMWAFLDKLLALGFSTGRDPETGVIDRFGDAAWINGANPTEDFLANGVHTKGFLVDFYAGLAGSAIIDWIYMASMLLIGAALMLGVFTRLAAMAGIVWMLLFYSAAAIWPENNPVIDYHLVYAIVLAGIAVVGAGRFLGFGRQWEKMALVSRHWILR